MVCTISGIKRDFLSPVSGFQCEFLFAALSFCFLFQITLWVEGAYATILTMGAIGSIIGALIASKIKSSMEYFCSY